MKIRNIACILGKAKSSLLTVEFKVVESAERERERGVGSADFQKSPGAFRERFL